MLSGVTPEQQQLIEYDREHGLNSTFYLGRRILGYNFDDRPHRGICKFVDGVETTKKGILLDPRGCYKTSVVSQAFVTRRIIKNPNIRILLDSVALTNSVNNLKVVRGFFEAHVKLRELYGDFRSKDKAWNDGEFTVSKRTDLKLKEATVTASSIDKVQIGPHYDLIIADDLHNWENTQSVEQIQKVKEHMRLLFGLLEPNGEMIIAGHRWTYTDAYSMVLGETENSEEREFAEIFKGEIYKHGALAPNGDLYFPRVYTREVLAKARISYGKTKYAAMLMNEPVITGDDQKFDPRYFKVYKEPLQTRDEVTKKWFPKINLDLTIDPGGREKGNDEWVVFESGIDSSGFRYRIRYDKFTGKVSKAAERIYRWWLQRKDEGRPYKKIGFETYGQQGQMLDSMKDYLWDKYQVTLPFKELKHTKDSKHSRIEAMEPMYNAGKIYHSEQMREIFGLEDQLQKYPMGNDDIADAASMHDEIAKAPAVITEEPPAENLEEMIFRRNRDKFSGGSKIVRVHPIFGSDY